MSFAAFLMSKTLCPIVNMFPPIPHIDGGFVIEGSFSVLINGMPAARLGSIVFCIGPIPHPSAMVMGSISVLIEGLPACRVGDMSDMASIIIEGSFDVEMG